MCTIFRVKWQIRRVNSLAAYPVYVRKQTIRPDVIAAKTPNVNDLSGIESASCVHASDLMSRVVDVPR